ncbi:class I glutamine amidotransferase-like protein [Mariannaea sp. PMI_226]|nr:class I glutamine amidotransferase-like protein [Mariannaea sp. PMI_226]
MAAVNDPPTHYGVVLFPGFQALDAFGSLDALNTLSSRRPLRLSVLAETLDPVSTKMPESTGTPDPSIGQSIVPTHTFSDAPSDIQVLLVPGGKGTRNAKRMEPVVAFLKNYYPKLEYLLTVCTGSALAAWAGVLDGHKATTNKLSFQWVTEQGPNVDWVRRARWVTSGNIWTSSGISAGIDMIFAFISEQYGEALAEEVAVVLEYVRNKDPTVDPFARQEA